MIIERLREESNYTCLKDYDGLAFDFRTTKEKIKSVIEDFDLFEFTDDGYFYSKSLKQRMLIKDEKSKKRSEAGVLGNEKRWKKPKKTPIENHQEISTYSYYHHSSTSDFDPCEHRLCYLHKNQIHRRPNLRLHKQQLVLQESYG